MTSPSGGLRRLCRRADLQPLQPGRRQAVAPLRRHAEPWTVKSFRRSSVYFICEYPSKIYRARRLDGFNAHTQACPASESSPRRWWGARLTSSRPRAATSCTTWAARSAAAPTPSARTNGRRPRPGAARSWTSAARPSRRRRSGRCTTGRWTRPPTVRARPGRLRGRRLPTVNRLSMSLLYGRAACLMRKTVVLDPGSGGVCAAPLPQQYGHCPPLSGRLSGLRVSHSESVLCGVFVWAPNSPTTGDRRAGPGRIHHRPADPRAPAQHGGEVANSRYIRFFSRYIRYYLAATAVVFGRDDSVAPRGT